jgi:uncharacterized SAM-binding protein YcdF (DUF218 family)
MTSPISPDANAPPSPPVRPRGRVRRGLAYGFRTARNILASFALVTLLLVLTPLGDCLYNWLNVSTKDLPKADVIVCLGGGNGREALAAVLWHRKAAPIVIVSNRPGAAEHMRMLVEDVGVPSRAILVDNTSATTHDHPEGVAHLPGIDRKKQRFVLVTDYTHSRRARDCFINAGYEHVTVWSGFRDPPTRTYLEQCESRVVILPGLIYEGAAILKYKLQGNI